MPSGSLLVARSRPAPGGCFSSPGLTEPLLFVRRFRHGLGCSPGSGGRFQPVVSGIGLHANQCQRDSRHGERSLSLLVSGLRLHGRGLCRQFYRGGLPLQVRGISLSSSEFRHSEDSPLGGGLPGGSDSPVHHGEEQHSG